MKTKADKHDFKFDVRASVYDEQFEGKFSEKVYRLVTETIELSPGDKILDVGCGTGTILRRLSDTCDIEGFGIDIEEKMIEQAKIKCPWMNIQKGDCSKMSFEDETFDSVIACMTFHHFYDQIAFAKEVSRALKTGGKLYIADPAFPMLIRKAVNAIINRHELIGKFCGNKEIEQIFKPYNLVWKKEKRNGIFQLIVFEKVVKCNRKERKKMFENIEWIFFDMGSTLVDEHLVYEHTFRDIAELTNMEYQYIYDEALKFYKQNKKGDIELGIKYNLPKRKWHIEDEVLYVNVPQCLKILSQKYKIGVIANQALGAEIRLEKWKILQYIDLVIASAEEGVSKPDLKIFEIALQRAKCEADKAVMVGDRIDNDIVPAKKMGMHTIWIKQGFGSYWSITGEDEKADFIVGEIMELCDCL